MSKNKTTNIYDDGNIPDVDLPQGADKTTSPNNALKSVEPLPETTRPRKDGPGGE